jgi:GNAT superfamily N-acetyltransferase
MTRDILYAEIARQREAELRRRAERHRVELPAPPSNGSVRERITLRSTSDPRMPSEPQRATIEDLVAIVDDQREFWGERDLSHLHHPLLVHEFGDTAFVVRDPAARVIAYLFGFPTPARVGYVHLVSVREGHRRGGLGRRLYAEFEARVRDGGAVALKALTRPSNARSIAFHRSLGFSATDTADYSGPGETRTVFWKQLGDAARAADSAAGLSN